MTQVANVPFEQDRSVVRSLSVNRRACIAAKVCPPIADHYLLPLNVTPLIDNSDSFRGHMQMDGSTCVWTVDELSHYVHDTLCRHENLVANQFALQTVALTKLGKRCGLQFMLRGPRSVRLGAVWSAELNHVYFYNARGERFLNHALQQTVNFEQVESVACGCESA